MQLVLPEKKMRLLVETVQLLSICLPLYSSSSLRTHCAALVQGSAKLGSIILRANLLLKPTWLHSALVDQARRSSDGTAAWASQACFSWLQAYLSIEESRAIISWVAEGEHWTLEGEDEPRLGPPPGSPRQCSCTDLPTLEELAGNLAGYPQVSGRALGQGVIWEGHNTMVQKLAI